MQAHTEELYKKDLHDPDNHDGVITDLEPDILECEVNWFTKVHLNYGVKFALYKVHWLKC